MKNYLWLVALSVMASLVSLAYYVYSGIDTPDLGDALLCYGPAVPLSMLLWWLFSRSKATKAGTH
jgi:hypothetical protein